MRPEDRPRDQAPAPATPAPPIPAMSGGFMDAGSGPRVDGGPTPAVAPGVVMAYDRDVYTNTLLRLAGVEVQVASGGEPARGPGRG